MAEDLDQTQLEENKRRKLIAQEYLRSLHESLDPSESVNSKLIRDVQKNRGRTHLRIAESISIQLQECEPELILKSQKHHAPTSVVFSHANDKSDSLCIFAGFKNGTIVQWHLEPNANSLDLTNNETVSFKTASNGAVNALAISPDDSLLVAGTNSGSVVVWDISPKDSKNSSRRHQPLHNFSQHRGAVTSLSFQRSTQSGSGTLYSASTDRTIKIWNLLSSSTITSTVSESAQNNQEMVSVSQAGYVDTLFGHQDQVSCISGCFGERCVSVGSRDRTMRLWKVNEESQLIFRLPEVEEKLAGGSLDVVVSFDDEHFATATDTGVISIWSIHKRKPLASANHYDASANAITLKNQADQSVALSNVEFQMDPTSTTEPLGITAMAALPQADLLVTASDDGWVHVWKVDIDEWRSLTCVGSIPVNGSINALDLSSNGRFLAVISAREQRLGRWKVHSSAKNQIAIYRLFN